MASKKHTPIQLPLPLENTIVEIPLTRGYVAIIDAIDVDLIRFKWFAIHSTDELFYAGRNIIKPSGKRGILFLHHVILERLTGKPIQEGEYADHIDLNSMNNTRANLRVVSNSLNQHNRRRQSNNTSGYKGVSFHKKTQKWTARIGINGEIINIGIYETPEEAYLAYCKKAIQLLGDKARLL